MTRGSRDRIQYTEIPCSIGSNYTKKYRYIQNLVWMFSIFYYQRIIYKLFIYKLKAKYLRRIISVIFRFQNIKIIKSVQAIFSISFFSCLWFIIGRHLDKNIYQNDLNEHERTSSVSRVPQTLELFAKPCLHGFPMLRARTYLLRVPWRWACSSWVRPSQRICR